MTEIRREELSLDCSFAEPATELQSKLCASFAEGLEIDRVGMDDDFFDLGGDSLAAERVYLLCQQCGVPDYPAVKLLTLGTPRKLANWLQFRLENDPGGAATDRC